MSIRKVLTLASTLTLTALLLTTPQANAHTTRELLTSFGSFEGAINTEEEGEDIIVDGVTGLAVDLETGNVYVADNVTETIYVFGATGGAPADGVPSQITGVHMSLYAEPSGVAVDNSCYEHEPRLTGKACKEYDPSYGDIYVMDDNEEGAYFAGGVRGIQKFKLNSAGKYELVGEIDNEDPTPIGVAVDSRGNVYVVGETEENEHLPVVEFRKIVEKVFNGGVEEFQEHLEELKLPQNITLHTGYVAVDDLGDVYVSSSGEEGLKGDKGVAKLKIGGSGGVVSEEVLTGPGNQATLYRPVAVEPATGAVYVGDGPEVAEYNAAGELQLTFGSTEPLGGSLGERASGVKAIAVNGPAGLVYVANELHGDVDVFGGVVGPPVVAVSQPAASSVTGTSALIAGTANPGGKANYYFEYVPAGEYQLAAVDPYSAGGRTAVEALTAGDAPETVERIVLTGLLPGTTYHYRMVVSNAAQTTYGPDETFTTAPATPPVASTGAVSAVGTTSATLAGTIDPRGLPTSYVFEVGTNTSYRGAKLFGSAGSSTGEVSVTVALQYLVPGVTYHYRLVATSFDGTSYGQDGTFTTPGVATAIGQPSSTPLISSPAVQFPSVAGAITEPVSATKTKKAKKAKKTKKAKKRVRGKRRKAGKARNAVRPHGRP
jgi:Beta-propeller repeat